MLMRTGMSLRILYNRDVLFLLILFTSTILMISAVGKRYFFIFLVPS